MPKRYVKLGRVPIVQGFAHHWAVQVGVWWYEIEKQEQKVNRIATSTGAFAKSGAGKYGGEVVGETTKSDDEIERFYRKWVCDNPTYHVFSENCQKFAIDFIRWLTDNCYHLLHQPDAARLRTGNVDNTIAIAHDGQAFASAHLAKVCNSHGTVSTDVKFASAGAEAIYGNGVGAWAEATLARSDVSFGPFGVSGGLNANTGIGLRGGNLDVHLLGFGVKIGADGLAVDTPLVGGKCSIM